MLTTTPTTGARSSSVSHHLAGFCAPPLGSMRSKLARRARPAGPTRPWRLVEFIVADYLAGVPETWNGLA